MPHSQGEHATYHHASAAVAITHIVHIKVSSDVRVVDWLLGKSRFQSRELLILSGTPSIMGAGHHI